MICPLQCLTSHSIHTLWDSICSDNPPKCDCALQFRKPGVKCNQEHIEPVKLATEHVTTIDGEIQTCMAAGCHFSTAI